MKKDVKNKSLELVLQALADELNVEDTFTITFRNGTIIEVEVLKITKTN